LKFWNWVQPLTRFASMPSGSVRCFSTSFHSWSFTESGNMDYLVFPLILYTWWARCPLQWPRIETQTCLWFFFEHKAGQTLTPPWCDISHHRRLVVYDLT
jgi:hypothetical protein